MNMNIHFGTFRPSKKNKKEIDFNWVTIAYGDKIQQFLGIITANKQVNYS